MSLFLDMLGPDSLYFGLWSISKWTVLLIQKKVDNIIFHFTIINWGTVKWNEMWKVPYKVTQGLVMLFFLPLSFLTIKEWSIYNYPLYIAKDYKLSEWVDRVPPKTKGFYFLFCFLYLLFFLIFLFCFCCIIFYFS